MLREQLSKILSEQIGKNFMIIALSSGMYKETCLLELIICMYS